MIELGFYSGPMTGKLPDESLAAQVIAAAWRYAARPLAGTARPAAITEIAGLALSSGEPLAQCAGITAGFHHGQDGEDRHLRAGQLCIEAGADPAQVHQFMCPARSTSLRPRAGR
jgi:hypothetical protein